MKNNLFKLSATKASLALAIAASLVGFMFVAPFTEAQSPALCTDNDLSMHLHKDVGATANGMVVNFQVEVSNVGASACDITNATISFRPPAADGTPTGAAVTLGTGLSFPANGTVQCWTTAAFACPAGDNAMINSGLAWTTAVNPGVNTATAQATQTGSNPPTVACPNGGAVLHDSDPGDTVCDSKTISVAIVDLKITIDQNSTNEINHSHTFTVTVQSNTGSGFTAVSGATVTPSITGTGSLTGTGTCETGTTDVTGHCTIIVNSPTTGIGTVGATTTVNVSGVSLTRALGDGLSGDSAKATKTWVDANIQISPLTATDPVNDQHVLTGHVNVNTGTGGYVNAPAGTTIHFSIVSGPGSLTPPSGDCLTVLATGECTVTLTSPTVGTTVVNASTAVVVGGVTLNRATGDTNTGDSANAQKNWTQTAITTTASDGVVLGNPIHDVAHLTGTSNATSGHITFNVYADADSTCLTPLNGSPLSATPDPVTGDGDFTSADFTPLNAGTYKWKAHYSGDANNNAADTNCNDANESVVVSPKTPTITTTLSTSSTNINTNVHDSAVLHNASANAGGTVTYHAYAGANTCSGTDLLNSTVNVNNGSVPNSADISFASAGTYSFQATYSGDGNNTGPVSSDCTTEQLVVNSFTAHMTTTVHFTNHTPVTISSVPAGSTVHDSATVTGTNNTDPVPTGFVDFTFFPGSSICQADVSAGNAGHIALVAGVADPSTSEGPLAPGVYSFRAHYLGDTSYPNGAVSDCEPFTVVPNQPTIATTLVPAGPVAIGASVHDSAVISGATADAGGTVTYSAYSGSNTCSGTDLLHSTKTVTNGVVPDSDSISFTSAGTYSFQATYSGDGNNTGPVSSACQTEQLVVNPNHPTISTTLSTTSPVNVGAIVHDSSALSGATADAAGTVTYTVYTDSICTQGAQAAGTKTVTAGVVPDSDPITFNNAGDFYWQAVYSGDPNNAGASSACSEEHLVVIQPQKPTRTLGFWQTHTQFAETIFNGQSGGSITLGGMVINTNGKLFGGFLAGISKTSTGAKRSALDQARMQLAQQWIAAELNCEAFGCPANILTMLGTASTDFSGTDASKILADAGALDTYNNSGDSISTSLNQGSATPKDSSAIANIPFWDSLH